MRVNEIQVTSIEELYERFDLTPIRTSLHSIHIDTRKRRKRRRPKFTPSKGDSFVSWGENGSKLSDSIERHFRNGGRANSSL